MLLFLTSPCDMELKFEEHGEYVRNTKKNHLKKNKTSE
ncbi:hypothetical protein NPIL_127181, partial [Nephila pilipes]